MPSSRSVRKTRTAISPRFATSTFVNGAICVFSRAVGLPDQLTVARAAAVPLVVLLYAWSFDGHDYWATTLFVVAMATDWFDGRIARRRGHTPQLGKLPDPVAEKGLAAAGGHAASRTAARSEGGKVARPGGARHVEGGGRRPRLDGRGDRRPRAAR